MNALLCLFPVLFIYVLGGLLLAAIDPGSRTFGRRGERFAIAPLAGLALLAAGASLLSIAHVRLSPASLGLVAIVPALATVFRRIRRPQGDRGGPGANAAPAGPPAIPRPFSTAFTVAAGCLLLTTALGVVAEPVMEWDAIAIWSYRAREIDTARTLAVSRPPLPGEVIAHPDYPPALPLLEACGYWSTSRPDDRAVKVIYLPFLVSLFLLLFARGASIDRGTGSLVALLGTALPVGIVRWSAGSIASAYSDFPLAVFIAAASWSGYKAVRDGDARAGLIAGILAGGAAEVKNEGGAFLAVLVVALAAAGVWPARGAVHEARRRALLPGVAALAAGLIAAPWWVLRSRSPRAPADYDLAALGHGLAALSGSRLVAVLRAFALELLDPSHWLLLWPVVILVIAWRWRYLARCDAFLGIVIAGQLLSYVAVYGVSTEEVDWLVATSLKRLVLHVAPLAVLFVAPFVIAPFAARATAENRPTRSRAASCTPPSSS